jgi:pimeloyl-ACP methyl ester carboxylesterase
VGQQRSGTRPGDLAELVSQFELRDAIHVAHSTGGGEVIGPIGRHNTSRVAKAVLLGADSAPSSTGILAAR